MDFFICVHLFHEKNLSPLENRKENAVLASVHFIRFENVIKKIIPIFGNQLWTVTLINTLVLSFIWAFICLWKIVTHLMYFRFQQSSFCIVWFTFLIINVTSLMTNWPSSIVSHSSSHYTITKILCILYSVLSAGQLKIIILISLK